MQFICIRNNFLVFKSMLYMIYLVFVKVSNFNELIVLLILLYKNMCLFTGVVLQAEEAHRLRKKKKAETMRLLDMERRQKQRVEEVRQSQKKVDIIIVIYMCSEAIFI